MNRMTCYISSWVWLFPHYVVFQVHQVHDLDWFSIPIYSLYGLASVVYPLINWHAYGLCETFDFLTSVNSCVFLGVEFLGHIMIVCLKCGSCQAISKAAPPFSYSQQQSSHVSIWHTLTVLIMVCLFMIKVLRKGLIFIFNYVSVEYAQECWWSPRLEAVDSPQVGVTGDYKPPNMVLGLELGSSRRTAHAFNHWTISSASIIRLEFSV